jgi:hypothetical protein
MTQAFADALRGSPYTLDPYKMEAIQYMSAFEAAIEIYKNEDLPLLPSPDFDS